MTINEHGQIVWTPKDLFALAVEKPRLLISGFLMAGHTPAAFPNHESYCDFLDAICERTGVHPRSLYLRGSCQIGFSIAPRVEKVWVKMGDSSDLDLVIIDSGYYRRIEEEIRNWEIRNPGSAFQDPHAMSFTRRQQDRFYNCCRDDAFPAVVGVHRCGNETLRQISKTGGVPLSRLVFCHATL